MFTLSSPRMTNFEHWELYVKPGMIEELIKEAAQDIIKKGCSTRFQEIYDAMYELAEGEVEAIYE